MRYNIYIFFGLIFLFNLLVSTEHFNSNFGTNGIVTAASQYSALANSTSAFSDGKIIVVGSANNIENIQNIILTKYNTGGSLDSSFGTNGIVTTTLGTASYANDSAIDGSNNIFIAGAALISEISNLTIVKYDSSGNVLKTLTESLQSGAIANEITIDGSGNIFIAGVIVDNGKVSGLICKYDSNLNLDTNFGTNGRVVVSTSAYHTYFNAIKIDQSGNILVGGSTSDNNFLLFRCDSSGTPDNSFGTNGIVTTSLTSSKINSIAVDNSNNIIAAGYASEQITLAKYDSNGDLITAFGTNGILTITVGVKSLATSILIDSNNKIVLTGNSDEQLIIVRYNLDGTADTSFGNSGILTATIGANDQGNDVIKQIDDNYIIAGFSDNKVAVLNVRNSVSSLVTINNPINSTYNQSIVKINGTSTASSPTQVDIFIDDVFFSSVNTDSQGNWDAGVSTFLLDGTHTIYAQFNNSVVSRDKKTFIIDTKIPASAAFGNTLKVDALYGNDATGVKNGLPFATVAAALAHAQTGDIVLINPGTYNESITIPNGIIVRGVSPSTCIIQKTNVIADTDLVTMGENCSLENIKLNLTSSQHVQLRGVVFPGTSSATSKVTTCSVIVNNSSASAGGTSNVYGIHSIGTGQSLLSNQALALSAVTVISIGNGNKRALLVDQPNTFNTLNSILGASLIAGGGSSIAIETNHASAKVQAHTTVLIGLPTADISQTSGNITLIGSVLDTLKANNNAFTNFLSPKCFIFADSGTVPLGTRYLRPGTATPAVSEIQLRISQPMLLTGLTVNLSAAPGSGNSITWTVRKNAVNTSIAVTIADTATNGAFNTASVKFLQGDLLSISQVASGIVILASDVIATVDYY